MRNKLQTIQFKATVDKPIEQTNHHQQTNKLTSCNKLLQSDKVQQNYHNFEKQYHKLSRLPQF